MAVEQTDRAPGIGIGDYIMRHIREYGLLFALIAGAVWLALELVLNPP